MRQKDLKGASEACIGILEWDGVVARNGEWVQNNRDQIVEILEHDTQLIDNSSPNREMFKNLYRFNAGTVKIYSLLLDDFIIYDGRFGAALGGLVRDWCLAINQESVPELHRFP